MSYPVALVRERALSHNIAAMARYCERHGVLLAPHAKTTMAPFIVRAQLQAGAWAATVAHVAQARALREHGVDRLLIANEVVTRGELEWIADAHARILFYVDSVRGVELAAAVGAPFEVLVEVGYPGGRTGCRTVDEARAVARAVQASGLRLAGVAAYEGLMTTDAGPEGLALVTGFLREVAAVAEALDLPDEPILTAGGSTFFDLVVAELGPVARRLGGPLILRSGCYVTHDHGAYERLGPANRGALEEPFQPALEVWAPVLSRPEPERAIAGAGKRDLASDMGLPVLLPSLDRDGAAVPLGPARVVALNDQHAHLEIEAGADVRPGDLAGFGISHPCALFDRWRQLQLVDDDRRPIGTIQTLF